MPNPTSKTKKKEPEREREREREMAGKRVLASRLMKMCYEFKTLSASPLTPKLLNIITSFSRLGPGPLRLGTCCSIHCGGPCLNSQNVGVLEENCAEISDVGNAAAAAGGGGGKVKRKKLKGKRAVVRWLKFFRWKKKKEYERMTPEEKILYKLKKGRRKEERLTEALQKIEPKETSETTHDPEVLTPEEHSFFLKMGCKCKNYVPVGRRGIYQGVILNMHLHWKKHQTLKVIVKTFSLEEVEEIASELARLTGGIVLDIHEKNTIIMYRGKNYTQPPTEIMSPRVTLSRKKALDKSKYRDGLRAVRKYIPRLEQDLELLRAQAKTKAESRADGVEIPQNAEIDPRGSQTLSNMPLEKSPKLKELLHGREELTEDETLTDLEMESDSEDLSDIFETDSETEAKETPKRPLYLDEFDKFPIKGDQEPEDFADHLRQISEDAKKGRSSGSYEEPTFDEVDRMFLRTAALLKKKRR